MRPYKVATKGTLVCSVRLAPLRGDTPGLRARLIHQVMGDPRRIGFFSFEDPVSISTENEFTLRIADGRAARRPENCWTLPPRPASGVGNSRRNIMGTQHPESAKKKSFRFDRRGCRCCCCSKFKLRLQVRHAIRRADHAISGYLRLRN